MSLNRRMKQGRILALTTTQGALGERVETWTDIGSAEFAAHPLSGNTLTQMSVKYENTSHVLLTRLRGIGAGDTRIILGNRTYETTFVNEAGRLSQVFAKVVS